MMSKHITLEDYNGINEKYKYGTVDGENWTPIDNFNCVMMRDNFPVMTKKYLIKEVEECTSLTIDGNTTPIQTDSKGDYVEWMVDSDEDSYDVVDNLGGSQTFSIIRTYSQRPVELDPDIRLYRGHTNDVTGLFDFKYSATYMNKPVESVYLSKTSGDTIPINIHVFPSKEEDYIAIDKRVMVPVETKIITDVDDFKNFDYGILGDLQNITVTITQDSEYTYDNSTHLRDSNITNESSLVLNGVTVIDSFITNNNRLVLNDCTLSFSGLNKEFVLVNNGELILNNCSIYDNVTILNNGSIKLNNCSIAPMIMNDLPFIHSSNNGFNFSGCSIFFLGTYNIEIGYGQCLYRAENYDPTKLLGDNAIRYELRYKYGSDTYITSGNGICYCEIDKDELKFINLTVQEEG